MTGRAVVYTRISSDRESREFGVDRQLEDCVNLAARRDLEVTREFRENDTGASRHSRKRRPLYADMLASARAGEFDVILSYSNSRLTRRPREYEDLITLFEETGVRTMTVASVDVDLSTANGRMIGRMLAAKDANEAEETAERVQRAARQRAEQGGWHGGNVPYGYRPSVAEVPARPATPDSPAVQRVPPKGPLVLHEQEAALIREAASRVLAGDTLYGVVKDWNTRGVTTGRKGTKPRSDGDQPGQHWRQGNLRAKLLNRALLGETKAGTSAWQPVLDAATFDRLSALLNDPSRNVARSPGVRSTKYTMAGGLTLCGGCGRRMISNVHRGRPVLFCSKTYSGEDACGSNRVEHDALEVYVLDETIARVTSTERWAQRQRDEDPQRAAAVEALDRQVAELDARRLRVLDMYQDGLLSKAERDARLEPLQEQSDAARRQRDDLLGRTQVADVLRDGTEWRTWSPARRRSLLRAVHGNVVVVPERCSPPHRLKDEDDVAFAARRADYMLEHVKGRVRLPA